MKTLIEVTQQHINEGTRGSCDSCPIALAVMDRTSMFYTVGQDGINYTADKEFPIPNEVRDFIQMYDNGECVYPFSFYLDIPEQYLKS